MCEINHAFARCFQEVSQDGAVVQGTQSWLVKFGVPLNSSHISTALVANGFRDVVVGAESFDHKIGCEIFHALMVDAVDHGYFCAA